jgi:hypothetical protein
MRLNRVLLLAAVINIMIFAMVFTISCSGDEGKRGRDGKNCSIDKDSDGKFQISCDGVNVGSFEGSEKGADGEKGEKGEKGASGKDGEGCWLGGKVDGSYEIICGEGEGEVKGSLEGCNIQTIDEYEVSIKCGSATVNLCGKTVFDPSKESCDEGKIEEDVDIGECGLTKVEYDKSKQYCGYASEAAMNANEKTVFDLCGKDASKNKPNDENQTEWKNEYCRYTTPKEKEASDFYCGTAKMRINENSWLDQYCGYASATALVKTVQKGLCDDYTKGPNEDAFGSGYCVADKKTGKTKYTSEICGASGKPNNGKWKSEYCGNSKNNTSKVVYDKGCDECGDLTEGPCGAHTEEYNGGYCKSNRSNITTYTSAPDDYCIDDNKTESSRMNEGSWKGEYCGFTTGDEPVNKVYTGACENDDDGIVGPNSNTNGGGYCRAPREGKTYYSEYLCEDDGKKVNEGKWSNQYCGINKNDLEVQHTSGACDVEVSGIPMGPNSDSYEGGFCQFDRDDEENSKKGYTKYVEINEADRSIMCPVGKFDAADPKYTKLNANNKGNQYCGFASSSTNSYSVITVSDAKGGAKCAALGPNSLTMPDLSPSVTNADRANAFEYCTVNIDGTMELATPGDNSCKTILNEGSWKGEYCFVGGKTPEKGTCTGGKVGDPSQPKATGCSFPTAPVVATCATDWTKCENKTQCMGSTGGWIWDEYSTPKACVEDANACESEDATNRECTDPDAVVATCATDWTKCDITNCANSWVWDPDATPAKCIEDGTTCTNNKGETSGTCNAL